MGTPLLLAGRLVLLSKRQIAVFLDHGFAVQRILSEVLDQLLSPLFDDAADVLLLLALKLLQLRPHSVREVVVDEALDVVALLVEDTVDAKVKIGDVELEEGTEQGLEIVETVRHTVGDGLAGFDARGRLEEAPRYRLTDPTGF